MHAVSVQLLQNLQCSSGCTVCRMLATGNHSRMKSSPMQRPIQGKSSVSLPWRHCGHSRADSQLFPGDTVSATVQRCLCQPS